MLEGLSVECQSVLLGFFQVEFLLHSSDVDRTQIQAIHVILNVSNPSHKISDCFLFDFFILHNISMNR